jgi:hypothetical protein
LQQLETASYRISFDSQPVNYAKEGRRLSEEQQVIFKSLNGGDRSTVLS